MLVINRKSNESIVIGDNIEIIVSEIENDRVKLCINAPREVAVFRKELLEAREINVESGKNISEQSISELKSLAKNLKKSRDVNQNGSR